MSCCIFTTLGYIAAVALVGYLLKVLLWEKFKAFRTEKMLARWKDTPKDVVIVHGFRAGLTMPNPSPFVIKVLTYLRMCGIKYETDDSCPLGPKGKAPWISLNGEHLADSQLIVEFLSKKFEKDFSHNYTQEQLGVAKLIRVVLEEHTFWGVALERFAYGGKHYVNQVIDLPVPFVFVFKPYMDWVINNRSKAQGIGLHSQEQVVQFMKTDLFAISAVLGTKRFICGDEPCEEDCAIFGFLSQCVWGLPHSPYEKLVKEELKNLEQYCLRMREKFWPDWDQLLLVK